MRYQAKLLTLSHCTIINAMILLSILSFVGDFVTAVIIFNFITFYFVRRLQWWHLYCKTIFFWIKAKKLDNFTFNTFTFSYPIFHARVNHFPNIWTIHAKIGVRKYEISPSPSNKPLNGAGSLSCRPVTCTVYKIINTANWSLKQKIYILKYICLYIFRFILLFTSSLPFYNFLQTRTLLVALSLACLEMTFVV